VRLTFLLDENILYHAIRGVDQHDRPDPTAAELIKAIATICHGIFVHQSLLDRYSRTLRKLREYPPRSLDAQNFIKQLAYNSAKQRWEYGDLAALPESVSIPEEDRDIVRAGLISRPIMVTHDSGLKDAINTHRDVLGLTVFNAREALELARSEQPENEPG
jgi:hypothetical protein